MGLQRCLPLLLNYIEKLVTYFMQMSSFGTLNLSENNMPKSRRLSPFESKRIFRCVYSDEQRQST